MRIFLGALPLTAAILALANFSTAIVDGRPVQSLPASPESETLQALATRFGSTVVAYSVSDESTMVQVIGADGPATTFSIPVTRARLGRLTQLTWPGTASLGDPSLPAPEAMPKALGLLTMRGGVALASTGQEAGAYRVLYELLVRPIRGVLPGRDSLITFVADDPLAELSFAALSNENGRFLLEDYRLHFVNRRSAGRERSTSPDRGNRFVFVANPASTPPLTPIPGSEREVRAVVRSLGLRDATILAARAATESAIRTSLATARVVHFATHEQVSAATPANAALALAGETGGRAFDGQLTAVEVGALHLSTELVVLSVSRAIVSTPGAMLLQLPRAFLLAGAHATLTTLWDISEETWERLMPRFYEEWQRSGDKSGALRSAQLALLGDLRTGRLKVNSPSGDVVLPPHPLLWANLILIGEP